MANGKDPLSCIDTFCDSIDALKKSLDETFKFDLSIDATDEIDKVQSKIDDVIVTKINPTINAQLAESRAFLIDSLHSLYEKQMKLMSLMKPVNDTSPTNLSSVITFCQKVKDFLVGAYEELVVFIPNLMNKLIKLSSKINELVNWRPSISADIKYKGLNFDKLDIKCEPITLSDITGGADINIDDFVDSGDQSNSGV